VLIRELHLTATRSCMRSTKLSPLLSLLESVEHVHACEPNLTAAQPVAAGTRRHEHPFRRGARAPDQLVYAFALRHASAYNLTDAGHPSLVTETFSLLRAPSCSPSPSCRVSDQGDPFLCLDGSLGVPEPRRVA
jgi:hypothetical protein